VCLEDSVFVTLLLNRVFFDHYLTLFFAVWDINGVGENGKSIRCDHLLKPRNGFTHGNGTV
jgi:hypothetical protein